MTPLESGSVPSAAVTSAAVASADVASAAVASPDVASPVLTSAVASPLSRVLEAHRTVATDLSSTATIDRLLLAAVTLTGADFGAVAVLAPTGTVERTTLHRAELADEPGLRDVLGARAAGGGIVPAATDRARHAGAGSMLGCTVQSRGVAYAELFVGVHPPDTLGEDAEPMLQALAELAGTAVENALLHEEAQRNKDWLQASGEIARTLLSDARGDGDMLMQVVLSALHVAEADSVALLLPEGGGRLRVAMAAGRGGTDFSGVVIEASASALGRAILRGESTLVDDMAEIMREGYDNVHGFGPVMSAPLVDAQGVRGAVVLCRRRGRAGFTTRDLDLATTFADQLALALEMDDARVRSEWVTVLENRHRNAQDLHDNVLQRLFATGVGLQSLASGALPPELADRLARYIAELDETIDEIRTRVFGLRDADPASPAPAPTRFPRVPPDGTDPATR